MKTLIIIDNGHGLETKGKRSPNGEIQEWKYCREVAKKVVDTLLSKGYNAVLLTPEGNDIPLSTRVNRANQYTRSNGGKAILVSIHLNAAGDGSKWINASGWECYTSRGETKSDQLAEQLYKAASKNLPDFKMRKDLSDGDADKEADFYILKNTICPAVLTENLFMDSHEDFLFLSSSDGFWSIVRLHVEGITSYLGGK